MGIDVRQEVDVTVVTVAGKMKIGQGINLWETVTGLLDEGRDKIVISMSGVTGMDSAGVGELVASHTSAERRNAKLRVAGLSPKVAQLLQITQLVGVLKTSEYEEEAITELAQDK